ncbi:hypothetical protein [Kiloniella laminariae]|uniref:hypothetical protein n=1 Tax=Kiloniella laminariae TaxID=454162 RepID=UPI0003614BA0|nr:hypothetical protein [Kiloniella laminariae]
MHFLFKIFLLFCSRELRSLYAEKQRQGLIDARARLNYFLQFFFWLILLGLALYLAVIFFEMIWGLSLSHIWIDELMTLAALLLSSVTFYSTGRSKIRQLEKNAFIYSAGAVAVAVLVDKVSRSGGKYEHSYRYEVEGKPYWLECDYEGEQEIGDKDLVIYVRNLPKIACLYNPAAFRRDCLIRDKPEPGKSSGWDLGGHLAQAENTLDPYVSPEQSRRNNPPWKQE